MPGNRRNKKDAIKEVKDMDSRIDRVADNLKDQLDQLRLSISSTRNEDCGATADADKMTLLEGFEVKMLATLKDLKSELTGLKNSLIKQIDDGARKSYMNYIIIHGMVEKDNENVYVTACNLIASKLGFEITVDDLNTCYRFGKKTPGADKNKTRPVAVEFIHRWKRDKVYNSKKKLKGSGVMISEMLTSATLDTFKLVCEKVGSKKCWTWRGNIFIYINNERRRVYDILDVPQIVNK